MERITYRKNILNIVLGTDDELDKTSLANKDLYSCDLFLESKNIKNKDNHPFEFYQKKDIK
jgi:hypothetical protein